MNIQTVINSQFGIGTALVIGRVIPPRLGYTIAQSLGEKIASRKNSVMVQAARLNQWVVRGETLSGEELDQAVTETVSFSARTQYDLYHNLHNPGKLIDMYGYTPAGREIVERCKQSNEGLIIMGVHLSSLDMGFFALGVQGVQAIGISVANPGGGYKWQNDLRNKFGFVMLPASKRALRIAVKSLEQGKTVVSGIDRPIVNNKYKPNFFGRPASLPVTHVALALKTNKPIYLAVNIVDQNGKYILDVTEPIKMKSYSDRHTEFVRNAEAVLERAEDFISRVPEQWAMYYPVWPEVEPFVP